MIYAPLVEKGIPLGELLKRPKTELIVSVRLINRLNAFREGAKTKAQYEAGADLKKISADETKLLENYMDEMRRMEEHGYIC